MRVFYAYLYIDPRDGVPFYVGKGHGFRARKHLWKGPGGPLRDRIAAIRADGHEPTVSVTTCADEAEAFRLERALIDVLGRLDLGTGSLLNRTAGGQGSAKRHGFKHSEETKARIRASTKGRPMTAEHKAKISAAAKGRPGPTPEVQAKALATRRLPENREKARARAKQLVTPEHLAQMTERAAQVNRGGQKSDEAKRKLSASMKGRVYSPETLARMSEGQKQRYARARRD